MKEGLGFRVWGWDFLTKGLWGDTTTKDSDSHEPQTAMDTSRTRVSCSEARALDISG